MYSIFESYEEKLKRDLANNPPPIHRPKIIGLRSVQRLIVELSNLSEDLLYKLKDLDQQNDTPILTTRQRALQNIINEVLAVKLDLYLLTITHHGSNEIIYSYKATIVGAVNHICDVVQENRKIVNDDSWFNKIIIEPVSNFFKMIGKFFNINTIFSTRKILDDVSENLTEKYNSLKM